MEIDRNATAQRKVDRELSYLVNLCLTLRLGLGKNSTIQASEGLRTLNLGFSTGNSALFWTTKGLRR